MEPEFFVSRRNGTYWRNEGKVVPDGERIFLSKMDIPYFTDFPDPIMLEEEYRPATKKETYEIKIELLEQQ